MSTEQRHAIAIIVENKPNVLHRVSNMFSRRGFNIESISVGATHQEGMARMTIVVKGDDETVEQVIKQLGKLIDVVKVTELKPAMTVAREMALIKIYTSGADKRSNIINYTNIFRGHIIDVSSETITVEVTGGPDKIDAFINLMKIFGIKEVARTGITALSRGSSSVKIE